MKASNSRDATPAQYLEHLRLKRGIDHARQIRDELGWRWKPSAMIWTIRHNWLTWILATCSAVAAIVAFLSDLKEFVS